MKKIQNYHFRYENKKENHPKLSQICSYGIFPRDSSSKRIRNSRGKGAISVPATEGLLYMVEKNIGE